MTGNVIFDCTEELKNKKRRKKVLTDLDDIYSDDLSISSARPKKEKKKEEPQKEELSEDESMWLSTISGFRAEPIKKKKKKPSDIFDIGNGKKKRKKKKKDGVTDYNKEFEHEARIFDNLMRDQAKFTDSLQNRYNALEATKSSSRGVGKFTTDLIDSINNARSLTLQIAKEKANLKKSVADLTIKERKEFGGGDANSTDIGLMGSSMLQKLISETARGNNIGDSGIVDADMDDMFDDISEEVGRTDEDDEIDTYLKYESSEVKIYVCINENDETDRYFIAKDKYNNTIEDYVLPDMTELKINRSTNVATDSYSRKYPIIWE